MKLLQIDGVDITKIVDYTIERNKLFANADRNIKGDLTAQFIGIFPKLIIKVGYLTKDEMENLSSILDKPFFMVEYFDNRTGVLEKSLYNSVDYSVTLNKNGMYNPFEFRLIPVKRRVYE